MENKKILIIDDDQAIVKYLEKLFNNNGYDTILAHDGLEADDIVKETTPDLITLDLDMPREWGTRFYRKLTKKKECKDIPVIVVSGMAGRDHSIKKAVGIFGKPFDPDKLMATVKETIG
ncbi:MAG: response regulator [Deltaproteobacteria bacterium]|nr:response regulator [Deltaproteobacteria bacterium]